jgi:hypothetical protein
MHLGIKYKNWCVSRTLQCSEISSPASRIEVHRCRRCSVVSRRPTCRRIQSRGGAVAFQSAGRLAVRLLALADAELFDQSHGPARNFFHTRPPNPYPRATVDVGPKKEEMSDDLEIDGIRERSGSVRARPNKTAFVSRAMWLSMPIAGSVPPPTWSVAPIVPSQDKPNNV